MTESDKAGICRELEQQARDCGLYHLPAPTRYDPGHVFDIEITGVCPATTGHARLEVERFIGGGFAGQVYRTRLIDLDLNGGAIPGLEPGNTYAIKVIVPPSGFSLAFRNAIYWLGFQGPFAAQVNVNAARAGVLWQKLIVRGAALEFDDPGAAADTYATFFDEGLRSYGEINEWIEGRNWGYEIDEDIFGRGKRDWREAEASREFLAKKEFMARMVRLLHEMGAPEFARQYEWWTCKSQPNVLKRVDHDAGPADGLTALDFRAGLALLPFLPMSPADVVLIGRGLRRGALVQFDRGNLETLTRFVHQHEEHFADLLPVLEELRRVDPEYRMAQPDLTRHAFQLVYDKTLRHKVKAGLAEGWRVRGQTDAAHAERLKGSFVAFWVFFALGFIPFAGRLTRRLWCNPVYRRHVIRFFTSWDYANRTWRAHQALNLADWFRSGKSSEERLGFYMDKPFYYWTVRATTMALPLPPKWHRFGTEWDFAWQTVKDTVAYPIRFYRDADFRVQWLTDEIEGGAREGMLTQDEKRAILERVPDPFIQKYLKCVAVHVCTLPITQVISLMIAVWAWFTFGQNWQESMAYALGVLAVFQVMPVSPGSTVRGTYVLYLMIRERNWRNYWLAALVSFWHYIGYLGFPLQMVKTFPALSRFMAGRWATRMVGIIPVFGERGALLEHFIFDFFFNVPLTIKRRFTRRGSGAPPHAD